MQIYLPIAEVSANFLLLVGLGGMVGILSGMFGVGGGFILTPLLFFIGIPPSVAVATGAIQVVASSLSGVLAHFKRGTVDIKMGLYLLVGGLVGANVGVRVFTYLKELGQVELMVNLCYVVFLGLIGSLMLVESLNAMKQAKMHTVRRPKRRHSRLQELPFKARFRTSKLFISVVPVLGTGLLVGLLSAIMGVGGGFIMVPAMIYILGMPTKVVVGTSLFQIIFVAAYSAMMHAVESQTVDIVLAVSLLVSGVIGAQIGTKLGLKLKAEQLRVLLASLVLAMCIKIAFGLVFEPDDLFNLL
ncbi:MAG: sulfite exporter TauE/SafE family protein [Rhodobacterales bacterium]|nr:sulfite exporter TauE/SafE family protein [Rhodobacterales bacterium]